MYYCSFVALLPSAYRHHIFTIHFLQNHLYCSFVMAILSSNKENHLSLLMYFLQLIPINVVSKVLPVFVYQLQSQVNWRDAINIKIMSGGNFTFILKLVRHALKDVCLHVIKSLLRLRSLTAQTECYSGRECCLR
jgi:hypothetical protein